jgi:ElaB/YqjD/DUF883 family membrane-anchored ribosome-binding protein
MIPTSMATLTTPTRATLERQLVKARTAYADAALAAKTDPTRREDVDRLRADVRALREQLEDLDAAAGALQRQWVAQAADNAAQARLDSLRQAIPALEAIVPLARQAQTAVAAAGEAVRALRDGEQAVRMAAWGTTEPGLKAPSWGFGLFHEVEITLMLSSAGLIDREPGWRTIRNLDELVESRAAEARASVERLLAPPDPESEELDDAGDTDSEVEEDE